jgi:hypothetical protein
MRSSGSFILGYHGCYRDVGEKLLAGDVFVASEEEYDWLGPGVYFWENDPRRALEWAKEKVKRAKRGEPMVVGAVIVPGRCLDLTTRDDLDLLQAAYESLKFVNERAGADMPRNKDLSHDRFNDRKLRFLDCAVIRHLEKNIEDEAEEVRAKGEIPVVLPIQTVRGLFVEGGELYEGGGFFQKTHSQIAVVDQTSILGVFRPRPYPV